MTSMATMIWLVLFRRHSRQDSWSLLEQVSQYSTLGIVTTVDELRVRKNTSLATKVGLLKRILYLENEPISLSASKISQKLALTSLRLLSQLLSPLAK